MSIIVPIRYIKMSRCPGMLNLSQNVLKLILKSPKFEPKCTETDLKRSHICHICSQYDLVCSQSVPIIYSPSLTRDSRGVPCIMTSHCLVSTGPPTTVTLHHGEASLSLTLSTNLLQSIPHKFVTSFLIVYWALTSQTKGLPARIRMWSDWRRAKLLDVIYIYTSRSGRLY